MIRLAMLVSLYITQVMQLFLTFLSRQKRHLLCVNRFVYCQGDGNLCWIFPMWMCILRTSLHNNDQNCHRQCFYAREHIKVFSSLNQVSDLSVIGKILLKKEWRTEGSPLRHTKEHILERLFFFWKRFATQIHSQHWEWHELCQGLSWLELAEWKTKITLKPNQGER